MNARDLISKAEDYLAQKAINAFDKNDDVENFEIECMDKMLKQLYEIVDEAECNEVFSNYLSLHQIDKDNIRRYSCYKAADDTLKKDIDSRNNAIEIIGNYSFDLWITDDDTVNMDCEDFAVSISNAINNNLLSIDDLIFKYSYEKIIEYCSNDFIDLQIKKGQ